MNTEGRVRTGIEGLDQILRGGLPAHHVYLIEGTPGTGKTTIALQFALEGLSAGETVLYVALSETSRELREVASARGWNLDGLLIFEITAPDPTGNLSEDYTIFHSDEVEMAATIEVILARVADVKASRVIIDSLAELRLLSRDAVRYRRQVLALKQHFTSGQITVLLLDDRTSQHTDHQLQSLVHGVITLERLPREYGKNRRRLEIGKLRGAEYADGYHDYSIDESGVVVFPRLVSAHERRPFSREAISSNLKGLDDLLGGGLDHGTATLLIGPSGCGKTTLSMKYVAAAVARGEPASVYTFDEGIESLLSRADSLGLNLTEDLRAKRISIEQINPAELSPGDFAHRVRQSVERDNARVIVIDSLNGYLSAMPQEEFLILQMHELLTYLNQQGVVTILILAQHGIVGPMLSDLHLSYIADSIVLLRFFEANGRVLRAISVVKKRSGKHEQTIREFTIGAPDAVQIGKPLEEFQGVLSGSPQYAGDSQRLSKQPR